jgi:hypothetical protein
MDLADPTHIGLILVVTGILGLAGGNLKSGLLEIGLNTTKGRFVFVVMLVILVGLFLILHDYFTH